MLLTTINSTFGISMGHSAALYGVTRESVQKQAQKPGEKRCKSMTLTPSNVVGYGHTQGPRPTLVAFSEKNIVGGYLPVLFESFSIKPTGAKSKGS